MPVYEYLCQKCGHEFEREQRISDAPVKTCPKCRARQVKRLISQTSFVLKGGGWYSDLYGSSKGKRGKKDSSEGGSGASKSESKSDSKSDTKADSKGESASKGSSPKSESKSAA
jgi:putative FmdB family regulatory protein